MPHLDHTPEKAAANGLATLDGSTLVPVAQLPTATTAAKGVVELAADGEGISGVVVQGNDARLSNSRTPTGPAGGDLDVTYPNPEVKQASKAFALNGIITPATFAIQQDNYNPAGLSGASVLRLEATAQSNVTGLAGGASGRIAVLWNVGSFQIILKKESASSTAANRFALATDVAIVPNGSIFLHYDATSSRWRVSGAAAGGGGGDYNVSFGIFQAAQSYIEVGSGTFTGVTLFRFPGSALAAIKEIKVILSCSGASSDNIGIRIFDLTNAVSLVTVDPLLVTTSPLIYSLGAILATPTAEAIIEVQLKTTNIRKPRIHAIDVNAVV